MEMLSTCRREDNSPHNAASSTSRTPVNTRPELKRDAYEISFTL